MLRSSLRGAFAVALTCISVAPNSALACACGCGVFAVGTASNFPTDEGKMVYLEYDFMNQNKNWSGTSAAPADANDDKAIRTSFYTAGFQYVSPEGWGAAIELPLWARAFKTTDEDSGEIANFHQTDIGDMRIRGSWSGLSDDRTTGITFGLKLPTGNYDHPGFDRDTVIGSGSTDLLLGIYHVGTIDSDGVWNWFANAEVGLPVFTQDGYRPGAELAAVAGVSYNGWSIGAVKIAPVLEAIQSYRQRDSGPASARPDSGYDRLLIAPGIQIDADPVRVYANVAAPLYENVNGNQLVAPVLFKLNVAYMF